MIKKEINIHLIYLLDSTMLEFWLGINKRPFITGKVLYECVANATLKRLVETEIPYWKSLLKQLFTNIQRSTFRISRNYTVLHILNKSKACTLNGAKFSEVSFGK